MSNELNIYDVLQEKLTDHKDRLEKTIDELHRQGRILAAMKAQFIIIYTIVIATVIAMIELYFKGQS